MTRKENALSFQAGEKENLPARLRLLIGSRSARSAAAEWGLSFSTLNNYLNRGTDPSFSVMKIIAIKEDVSLDWLAFGKNELDKVHDKHELPPYSSSDGLEAAWLMVYKTLSKEELEALMGLLLREGTKGILTLLNKKNQHKNETYKTVTELEHALLQLPAEEKERLMALHEAKKGASEECEVTSPKNPVSGVVRVSENLVSTGTQDKHKVKKSAS
ncbi:bacteriophage CI repressor [Salmonella enterica subsp. enterica serovar Manhattan]|nr:bacteriophage CI repressor [Salmonella enterica subsp. enterica serovar Manhattan]